MFSSTLAIAGLLAVGAVNTVNAAVPTISALGNKFFYSNGTQYFMKGEHSCQVWHGSCKKCLLIRTQELHISSRQKTH